jgi:hypothetical protein
LSDTSGLSNGADNADGSPALDSSVTDAPPDGSAERADADTGAAMSAYEAAVASDGPIAYFHFEETGGAACADELRTLSCAYSGTGIVHGVSGVSGAAVRLGTTSDAISVTPKSPDLSLPYTIEFWILLDVDSARAGQQLFRIEELSPSRSGLRGELFADGSQLRTEMWSGGVLLTYTLASGALTGATWHHVAHGFNPETQTDFTYLDGVASAGGKVDLGGSPRPVVTTPLTFSAWTGSLDELAIYDKALSPSRIVAHYTAR